MVPMQFRLFQYPAVFLVIGRNFLVSKNSSKDRPASQTRSIVRNQVLNTANFSIWLLNKKFSDAVHSVILRN